MTTLLKFERIDEKWRTVIVEIFGEKGDSNSRILRRTTINPATGKKIHREVIGEDDQERYQKAVEEEKKYIIRLFDIQCEEIGTPDEKIDMRRLSYTAELLKRKKEGK